MTRAISVEEFRDEFAEYADTDPLLIGKKIDEAQARCDETVWGSLWVHGIKYLAAHLLATSPKGRQARLQSNNGASLYLEEYKRVQRNVAAFTGRVI